MIEKIFKLRENGTTFRTEFIAGITTFCAMAYIIFVNPAILSETGMNYSGVMVATCLAAAIGSILTATLSRKPFAQAPGMGLNAFFAYTICLTQGYSWQAALAMTFISGLLFFILTVTAFRDTIIRSIPRNLKYAISAGIGLFIAVLGLINGKLIVADGGLLMLGDFKEPTVLLAVIGIVVTIGLVLLNVKGAILIGIFVTTFIGMIMGIVHKPDSFFVMPTSLEMVAFKLDFKGMFMGENLLSQILGFLLMIVSLVIVDMFNTVGFLIGAGSRGNMIDDDGNFKGSVGAMAADALATVIGALLGTSAVTTYAESATGMREGGKTGLVGWVVGICFMLSIFFSPIAQMVPMAATTSALIVVGLYLFMDIKKIDFTEMDEALPVFLTILFIPLAFSVTDGIAIGIISYVICKIIKRKFEEVNLPIVVVAVVFVLYYLIRG